MSQKAYINKDIYVGDTGKQLKEIETNGELVALYGEELADINSDLQTFWTTATAAPESTTAEKTILSRSINKGVYLFVCNLFTNNWGQTGRDFTTTLKLNGTEILNANQVLTTSCYSNTRPMTSIVNVTQNNSTLTMTVKSSSTAAYAVTTSRCYLLKLKSSDAPASSMITSQRINHLIGLLENATYMNICNYSTNETIIGTWADGRPIYRKTFLGLKTPNTNSWANTCDLRSYNVKDVIDIKGFFAGSDGRKMSINHSEDGYQMTVSYLNGYIQLQTKYSGWYTKDCYITVEYTKTTD